LQGPELPVLGKRRGNRHGGTLPAGCHGLVLAVPVRRENPLRAGLVRLVASLGAGVGPMSWSLLPDISPLRESPGFRKMFTSRTVAFLGSQAGEVAILVQAQRLTGSPLVVGTLGLAELVPLIVFGPYGGVLADRFDRRKLMVWCEPGLAVCA